MKSSDDETRINKALALLGNLKLGNKKAEQADHFQLVL